MFLASDIWQLLMKQLRNLLNNIGNLRPGWVLYVEPRLYSTTVSSGFVFIYFERDRVWIRFVARGSAIFAANRLKLRTLASDHVTCARVRGTKLIAQKCGPSRVITWHKILSSGPFHQKSKQSKFLIFFTF